MLLPIDQRRRQPRIYVTTAMQFVRLSTGQSHPATLMDLSKGGVSFRSPLSLDVGETIEIAIDALQGVKPVRAYAVVLRSVPELEQHRIAVAIRLDHAAHEALAK